jgi:hypothetical protein
MADSFESAWLKWAGAVLESHVLAANVNEFRRLNPNAQIPIRFGSEYHPQRHCIVLTVIEVGELFPPYWGVMLGNIVHNFRSALDHAAWALYKRGRTPNLSEQREKNVYFPVAETREKFNGSLSQKLPGVPLADTAVVRAFQPYRAGNRYPEHVLWVLDDLSRQDKHRAIHPVSPVPESTGLTMGLSTDCIYRRMARNAPRAILEPGAELGRIFVKKTGPDPDIDVQPHFTIDPSINARLTLEQFLLKTPEVISRLLRAFAEPPASIKVITGSDPPRPD